MHIPPKKINSQEAHEKPFNITVIREMQMKTTTIPLHTNYEGYYQKQTVSSTGKDTE